MKLNALDRNLNRNYKIDRKIEDKNLDRNLIRRQFWTKFRRKAPWATDDRQTPMLKSQTSMQRICAASHAGVRQQLPLPLLLLWDQQWQFVILDTSCPRHLC